MNFNQQSQRFSVTGALHQGSFPAQRHLNSQTKSFRKADESKTLSPSRLFQNRSPLSGNRQPDPGDSIATARDLGALSNSVVRGAVGGRDRADYFRFVLSQPINFSLTLNQLRRDADVQLLNRRGRELAVSNQPGRQPERINLTLKSGTYFIAISTRQGNTRYKLTLTTEAAIAPTDGLELAESQLPEFTRSQQVNASNPNNFYRFNLTQSGIFTANLTDLTGDADVRLIRDTNQNDSIDQGEILAWQWERDRGSEFIRRFLQSGTYFVQVTSYNNQTANYTVTTSFTPAPEDDQKFSIQLTLGAGLSGLTTAARSAIQSAVTFLEEIIPYRSDITGENPLPITIEGESLGNTSTIAFAGPTTSTAAGKLQIVSGSVTLNTNNLSTFNANPTYLGDTVLHEFLHVLGFGTLWETTINGKTLVNSATATYQATTDAGWAYGELLGTYQQTDIPVQPVLLGHWDEAVFDQELMTSTAEAVGTSEPLSQMTIASLRDLGWNVNYGAAQAYRLPTSQSRQSKSIEGDRATSPLLLRCACAVHLATSGLNLLGDPLKV
jgi:hypothetical protein